MSAYDRIARLYDPWSASVVEDVPFYLERARRSGGPVVELGVGTGRLAIPIAADGIQVIGVDASEGMLEVARERAVLAGLKWTHLQVDLRYGDFRDPPVEGAGSARARSRSARSSTCRPTRTGGPSCAPSTACSSRTGRFIFDVFSPGADDIAETHARWLEREPGIFERADWDERRARSILRVRGEGVESELSLAWISMPEWRELLGAEGFVVEGLYGWFDGTPWAGHEDAIFVCRRRD